MAKLPGNLGRDRYHHHHHHQHHRYNHHHHPEPVDLDGPGQGAEVLLVLLTVGVVPDRAPHPAVVTAADLNIVQAESESAHGLKFEIQLLRSKCCCYPGQAESGRLYGFHDGGVDMREPHVPHLGQGMCRCVDIQVPVHPSPSPARPPPAAGARSPAWPSPGGCSPRTARSRDRGAAGAPWGQEYLLSLLRSKIQVYSPRSYVLPGAHGLLARCDTSQFPSGGSCLLLTQLLRQAAGAGGRRPAGDCFRGDY